MLTGRKLLLADDSLTIQKVVSLTFNDEAMEVRTVGSGAEALESLRESLPDIVLADVFMPEPNGYQLCELIKRDERTRHLPVVLLVGTFEPFNEAEARRVGADEVLTKPFQSIRDLVNKVGGLLGGSDEKNTDAEHARDERHEDEATRDLSPFAADAHAAAPATQAAEAAATTSTTSNAFDDFDMDDATIQSTPAAAFDARAAQPSTAAFEVREEEQFSDRGETDEAFVLSDLDESPSQAHAATAAAASGSSYAASSNAPAEAAPVAAAASSSFSTHAARAAEADDALLDIGDIAPAHGKAAASEADDFILDIGDEDSFEPSATAAPAEYAAPPAHAAASVAELDMHYAENAPLTTEVPEAFAEPDLFAETQLSESPATVAYSAPSLLVQEPEDAQEEVHAQQEREEAFAETSGFMSESAHDAATDSDVSWTERGASMKTAATAETLTDFDSTDFGSGDFESGAAPVEAESERQPEVAVASVAVTGAESSPAVAAVASEQSQASPASSLSPEMMDELVRRVVAHMSAEVVREIAWEVVPDLAERLIKQRLEEEKTRPTP